MLTSNLGLENVAIHPNPAIAAVEAVADPERISQFEVEVL
jgi:hypothetical protein